MAKILLVEDNEMNRDSLSRLLARRGYEVVFAEDGEEAVALALAASPDLVLMDISLPKLDGYEATRRLRARPECRTLPIIALTAHAMTSDREKALEAGCTDFESKPVEFARLLGKIQKHLG
ncbi:response regulator [Mesoterricola sediminis]|uniref:Response regulator n=1 Tax=Mesoterricola sediminis TaxID=2927980 RepID=A0AA48KBJ5_9BACT|nr:response regulator [Mesoterricola sediminis]BDU76174.1 response regulator [Mesoterricola sediminis]